MFSNMVGRGENMGIKSKTRTMVSHGRTDASFWWGAVIFVFIVNNFMFYI